MIPGTLETGPSAWAPLAMLAGIAVTFIIALAIRALGKKGFRHSKDRAMPFYSGNIVTERERVKASDYFWGFFEALKEYYSWVDGVHTGKVNDYVSWFVAVASLLLLALALGGFLWA